MLPRTATQSSFQKQDAMNRPPTTSTGQPRSPIAKIPKSGLAAIQKTGKIVPRVQKTRIAPEARTENDERNEHFGPGYF